MLTYGSIITTTSARCTAAAVFRHGGRHGIAAIVGGGRGGRHASGRRAFRRLAAFQFGTGQLEGQGVDFSRLYRWHARRWWRRRWSSRIIQIWWHRRCWWLLNEKKGRESEASFYDCVRPRMPLLMRIIVSEQSIQSITKSTRFTCGTLDGAAIGNIGGIIGGGGGAFVCCICDGGCCWCGGCIGICGTLREWREGKVRHTHSPSGQALPLTGGIPYCGWPAPYGPPTPFGGP